MGDIERIGRICRKLCVVTLSSCEEHIVDAINEVQAMAKFLENAQLMRVSSERLPGSAWRFLAAFGEIGF